MLTFVISDLCITEKEEIAQHCMGCFSCFVKTPGVCVIKDGFEQSGAKMGNADRVVIISKMEFGGYSSRVKKILDRCLPSVHADFEIVNGQMRHARRYDNNPDFDIYFYSDAIFGSKQMNVGIDLVMRNANNLGFTNTNISYVKTEEAVKIAEELIKDGAYYNQC